MKNLILISFSHKYSEPCVKVSVKRGSNVKDLIIDNNVHDTISEGGQTIYITPGCSIPRHKIKELNFVTTIKPSKADCIVIPTSNFGDSSHYEAIKFIPVHGKKLLDFISEAWVSDSETESVFDIELELKRTKAFIKAFIDKPNTIFGICYRSFKDYFYQASVGALVLDDPLREFVRASSTEPISVWAARQWSKIDTSQAQRMEFISPKNTELFESNKAIYSEEALLKLSNKNKMVIDRDTYSNLLAYGNSEDEENKSLMMELMSNSDFEKSIPYLYMLLVKFGYAIIKIKGYDHISFRSLLTYLDLKSKNDVRYFGEHQIENKIKHKKLWSTKVAEDLYWAMNLT